jgi:hypothetical protein
MTRETYKARMIAVGDFFVENGIFTLNFECKCDSIASPCCKHGCWITPEEKWRIYGVIPDIAPYLSDRLELPFWRKTRGKWTFVDPKKEDNSYHVKVVSDRCIFNQTDGRCAIHSYCLDQGIPWETFKFNICVTWPLDIQLRDHDKTGERWHIWLFDQIHEPGWDESPCIRPEFFPEKHDTCTPIIISMKTTIISRIGLERYAQLVDFAETYKPN